MEQFLTMCISEIQIHRLLSVTRLLLPSKQVCYRKADGITGRSTKSAQREKQKVRYGSLNIYPVPAEAVVEEAVEEEEPRAEFGGAVADIAINQAML